MRHVLLILCILSLAVAADTDRRATVAVLTGDPATSIGLRSLGPEALPHVRWRLAGALDWTEATTVAVPVGNGLIASHVDLNGLAADCEYQISDPAGAALISFRTLPVTADRLTVVAGGDMMHTVDLLRAGCRQAAALRPALALIGGDWAYDNNDAKNVPRWLDLMTIWQTEMRSPTGVAIPLLVGVGNHELGKTSLVTDTFFAKILGTTGSGSWSLAGLVGVTALNTGHGLAVEAQNEVLEKSLRAQAALPHRITLYHVPAYPSVREFKGPVSGAVRTHWIPLFERGGVPLSLENHDHAYKRTHPLLKGAIDPKGITFLGDGCWGVAHRAVRVPARPEMAVTGSWQHVIELVIERGSITARAMGVDGKELDTVVIQPRQAAW